MRRRLLLAAVISCAACRAETSPRPGDYLFVWAGDSAEKASDFLAVIDANPAALGAGVATGVQMNAVDYHALSAAISRTVALYHQPEQWRRLQRNGMKCDFSWNRSGKAYADLYTQLVSEST